MGVPDEKGREMILKVMTEKMKLEGDFDFRSIAKKTPGYVGADIRSLTKEAAVIAINRIFKSILGISSKVSESTGKDTGTGKGIDTDKGTDADSHPAELPPLGDGTGQDCVLPR